MSADASGWIARLGLTPHPEGGWFRRIHTEERQIATARGARPLATSIHYLLDRTQPIGRLHRNASGILHFLQDGGPVEYLVLDAQGGLHRSVLGYDAGQAIQLFVPGGCWKGSQLVESASHALVSEVVLPGFDDADHEFAPAALLEQIPQHAEVLRPFLRD